MTQPLNPAILQQIQSLLRRDLKLGPDAPLPPDMPFFGGDVDLDSLDMLLLVTSIERQFGVRISNQAIGKEAFQTVETLARFVQEHAPQSPDAPVQPDQTDWLARLPHGESFRFISRVIEVHPGQSAKGVWSLTGAEPFFAGHFPNQPIVPGVLIAEALAQISGLASATANHHSGGKLVHVDIRFEQPAIPPIDIELNAKLTTSFGPLQTCEVWAQIGPTIVARGAITLHHAQDGAK